MATTVTSTSNYAGKEAGKIVGRAFREAETLRSGAVSVNENVNYKLNLRRIQVTGGRRLYTCGFVPAGAITLSEKVLEPIKFKDDWEICKEDFRNQWNDGDLGASAWNDGDMKVIMDAILAYKLGEEAEDQERIIWQGDSDENPATEYDGFLKLFAADATVIDVTLDAVTMSNVEAELIKAIGAIPSALKSSTKVRINVSSNIMAALSFLYISKGIVNGMNGDNADAKATTLTFGRYKIQELPGLPDDNIVIAEPENLVFATGSQADWNSIRMVDQDETELNGKIIGSMVYNAAVGYYNGFEIVWARPATPSV